EAFGLERYVESFKRESFKGSTKGFDENAMDLLIEGLREPITDLIFETATGTKKEMNLTEDYLICVRVMSDRQNTMIEGLNEENLKHIHLYNVSKDLAGNYYSWGGTVLKVTARGRSIKEARRRVYRTLKNIHIDDIQYRTDIGEDLEY
ncbi:MAG: hypothetical protein KKD77_23815, partial [Gammaproteobacteria bacterium]|nr:hypothetical protein [Gammaproteobacteria bacterium]